MYKRDYRDIISGGVLLGIGAFAAIYAYLNYQMGTPRHMGPGWFPFYLGIILAILGVIVLMPAFTREGSMEKFELKSFITVTASIAAFGAAIRPLGLVPAICILMAIAALADDRYTIKLTIIMAAVMSIMSAVIFVYALGMPLQMVNWRLFG